MEQTYYTFAFHSTHAAMAAQKLLTPLGAIIMPTLRELSASCGMSLRLSTQRVAQARDIMAASTIDSELYQLYLIKGRAGLPPEVELVPHGSPLPVQP